MNMNMNENNNEKKDFSLLKNFIMKLILIIIFVLMLIKFVPWPDMSGIAPLQEQIFNNNITTMKEAAIAYYTTERLPINVGDTKKLTLENMLELKLLVPLIDKNGNTCDVKESYVSIEKVDHDEYNYKMKVNLKCSDKEDYIYVYLGCYSYCEGLVCEKQETPVVKPKATSKLQPIVNPKPTSNPRPTYIPKPTPTSDPKPTPTNSPKPTPTNSPKPTPTNTPKPTPTSSPKPTPTNNPNKTYEYQYKKTTNKQYSAWTGWKVWSYKDTDVINWKNTDLYQIEDLGSKKVQVGTRTTTAVVTRTVQEKVGTQTYKVCKNYQYVADRTTVWQILTNWSNTDQLYYGSNPPADTTETRWVLVSWDPKTCVGDCTGHIEATWRLQRRTVKESTSLSNITATCTDVETRSIDIYVPTLKSETLSKTVPLYGYKKFYRDRTRTVTQQGKEEYTWSTYNNQTLINQGWVPTGKSREK